MNNLCLIAAIGKNRELGINNDLIWHFKEDMAFFKNTTKNKTIIMGRKCFESLPGLLPNRKHIILSKTPDYNVDGAIILKTVEEVLDYVKNTDEECFIIGGAKIYELFIPYCKVLYLTEINANHDADVYFPEFNKDNYTKEVLYTYDEFTINKYTLR